MNIRTFNTGATRNSEEGKLDYEGFLSPLVIERFGEYMHEHRKQEDGSLRDSDNWQKGIPFTAYMKSAWRHFHCWWKLHRRLQDLKARGFTDIEVSAAKQLEDAICALIFNAQGYLHEQLKSRNSER